MTTEDKNMSAASITLPQPERRGIFMAAFRPREAAPSQEEAAAAQLLCDIADEFLKFNKSMTLQAYACFMYAVANHSKGLGPIELAKKRGVSSTVFSRYMLDMGDRGRGNEVEGFKEGLGLVTTTPIPIDYRQHPVRLTTKGLALVRRCIEKLKIAAMLTRIS